MKSRMFLALSLVAALVAGCFSKDDAQSSSTKVGGKPTKSLEGLIIKELKSGKGTEAMAGLPVVVHYTGWLFDKAAADNKGNKFDSSLDRNQPFSFRLGSGMVIKGWDEGVKGMKVGEHRRLIIPPEMAYGSRGAGSAIPPDATLVFDVELLEVKKN